MLKIFTGRSSIVLVNDNNYALYPVCEYSMVIRVIYWFILLLSILIHNNFAYKIVTKQFLSDSTRLL